MSEEGEYGCPVELVESLRRYVEKRVPTGGFLRAVLSNDLTGAMMRADSVNRFRMYEIVMYIFNELPGKSWGSPEAVDKWLERREDEG